LWHLVGGSFLPVFALFVPRGVLLTTAAFLAAVFVAWEITRFISPIVNQWSVSHLSAILKPEQTRRPTGTTYALVASLALFLLFEKHVAITALFFLSIGDVLAGFVGESYGRHKIFKKSLEGSLACLVSCLVVALVMSGLLPVLRLPVAIAGAVIATIVELLPIPVDDNLTVPLISAGVMALLAWYPG